MILISKKFSGAADAAGLWATLWDSVQHRAFSVPPTPVRADPGPRKPVCTDELDMCSQVLDSQVFTSVMQTYARLMEKWMGMPRRPLLSETK